MHPDICLACDNSKSDNNGCNDASDLIFEIILKSTRQRDFQLKHSIYEEAGVYEYRISEPIEKVIYQNFMVDGKYGLAALLN